jgi:hypothetical protein
MMNVRQPLPDQTLESLVAVSTLWNGDPVSSGDHSVLRRMRGFWPPNLMSLYMLLGRHWFGSATTLLERHGYVVLLKPFVEHQAYDGLSTDILLGRCSKTSQLITTKKEVRAALHFCPACAESELTAHGYAYAHRAHQVVGVEVCTLHGLGLRKLCPKRGDWFGQHGVWTKFPTNSVVRLDANNVDPVSLRGYAEFVSAALEGTLPILPFSRLITLCYRRLARTEHLHFTDLQVSSLYQSAVDTFGRRFFEKVGCAGALGIYLPILASSFGSPHDFRAASYERSGPELKAPSATGYQRKTVGDEAIAA